MTQRRARVEQGGSAQLAWAFATVGGLVGLATLAAWPLYETPRIALVAAGGLSIGAGAVLGARALNWPSWTAICLAFGGYVLGVVPLAIPSAMTDPAHYARGTLGGVAGIVTAWKQLLTVSLPAGTYQGVLVPFLLVVMVGSGVAAWLVTSSPRWAPWAVAPLLAMVAFGAAFGTDATGPAVSAGALVIPSVWHVLIGVLAVVTCASWLVGRARIARSYALHSARSGASTVRQPGESRAPMLRRHLVAGALVLLALAAGVAAAPAASSLGPRSALRDGVEPVLLLERQASPLTGYRLNFTNLGYGTELFSISGAEGVSRIRIATLDTFDGQSFHVGDTASSEAFARQPGTQDGNVRITIGPGFSGVWVPVVDADGGAPRFEGTRADELAASYYASQSLDAAVVITDDADAGWGLRSGDSYTVGADASTAGLESLASVNGTDSMISATDFPGLAQWVDAQGEGRTGADLAVLVERLRARGYLSHAAYNDAASGEWVAALASNSDYVFAPSRSGHSAARVDQLFSDMLDQERRAGTGASPEQLVAAVGDDEQFAAAAALLARYLGFESRVVVGVRVGEAGAGAEAGAGVPACLDVCTGANVTAWAEARGGDGAWVVIDATPQHAIVPIRIEQGKRLPQNPTEVVQPGSAVLEPPSSQSDARDSANPNTGEVQPTRASTIATVATTLTAALAVVLVALPIAVFPAFKMARRRARRRAPVPEVSMVGAWDELVDSYTDFGVVVPRGLTRAEFGDVVDRPAAVALAVAVDTAVFGEHPPTADAAAATWAILTAERRRLSAESRAPGRLRAAFTPASFVRTVRIDRRAHAAPRLAGRTSHAPDDH